MSEILHLSEEDLHGLLDGACDAERRVVLEAHLDTCPACRAEHESLLWVKGLVAKSRDEVELPPGLEPTLRKALDHEDRRRQGSGWRVALSVAACLIGALTLTWWLTRAPQDLPTAAGLDYLAIRSGELKLDLGTDSPAELEAFFRRQGIAFRTRVIDLAMMSYSVKGGRLHRLAGRPSALFVYEGANGRLLVCEMFAGRLTDLARSAEVRSHRGFDFHIHRKGPLTLVFWQEGGVVCVLIGDLDPEEIVGLAFEKAML